jgi:NAD-dependent dihydropyrimidine dehydrogenase PreA subunit
MGPETAHWAVENGCVFRLGAKHSFNLSKQEFPEMTYVITTPCIGVKDGACADVCPVDCIHPTSSEPEYATSEQLYINPDECIDCGACEPACPVSAVFEESAVPAQDKDFVRKNAEYFH